jgi:hypothetical protein
VDGAASFVRRDDILAYLEVCQREGGQLQKGMNFRLHPGHSVILMSMRPNAPYADRIEERGRVLIYEGHNLPKSATNRTPEIVDQPRVWPSGKLRENGKFEQAALAFKAGKQPPERVRVYEKIHKGIWSYNGVFHLEDAWVEKSGSRNVFKFRLTAVAGEEDDAQPVPSNPNPGRVIPSHVKLTVWKRDGGRCAKCDSKVNLHFDHIIPWSKGGASTDPENIQILCGAHNIAKSDDIE